MPFGVWIFSVLTLLGAAGFALQLTVCPTSDPKFLLMKAMLRALEESRSTPGHRRAA